MAVVGEFRWPVADSDSDPQLGLFGAGEVLLPELGTGRMSGLEFLHVTAKQILNRVPGGSPMPFGWTINAYRGCSHACTYCLTGDTEVLLATGATKPLAEIRPGDRILGTERRGPQRRYVQSTVRDQWQTTKPAYRVTLAAGTTITGSADHRLLTVMGWKHIADDLSGSSHRAHLKAGDILMGPATRTDPGLGTVLRSSAAPCQNQVVSSNPALTVELIEPLGVELPMYDITTDTGDFVASGVISHNCFARPTHAYLGLDTGADFDRRIVVKINAVEKLRAELRAPTWAGEPIAMGTNTDPYQRCEAKYRLTRGIVAALGERANPFSILTKSALVLRDLDLLTAAARRTDVRVSFSIGTLDERVWRATEPGTPNPRRRVDAVAQLTRAGIPVGVLVAPVLPGLSDSREQLAETIDAVVAAGAVSVTALPLHLRPGVREHFLSWLSTFDPALHQRYLDRYGDRVSAPAEYAQWVKTTVAGLLDGARRSTRTRLSG